MRVPMLGGHNSISLPSLDAMEPLFRLCILSNIINSVVFEEKLRKFPKKCCIISPHLYYLDESRYFEKPTNTLQSDMVYGQQILEHPNLINIVPRVSARIARLSNENVEFFNDFHLLNYFFELQKICLPFPLDNASSLVKMNPLFFFLF